MDSKVFLFSFFTCISKPHLCVLSRHWARQDAKLLLDVYFQTLFFCFGYCLGLEDPLFITTTKCVANHDIHKAETIIESEIILRAIIRSALEFFIDNHFNRSMALGLTQPLSEMSSGNTSWGLRRSVRRADNLTTFRCRLSWNVGAWTSWNPLGLSRPVIGLFYLTY